MGQEHPTGGSYPHEHISSARFPEFLPCVMQPVISGANLLKWVEVLNEPNAWWHGRQGMFSSVEQAAMQVPDNILLSDFAFSSSSVLVLTVLKTFVYIFP